jgi:site-specific DNA recombinase
MKTAIYLRQSLDRDENKLAIDRQREACLDLCKTKHWADTVEYVDNDTSASTGRRRDYDQMLADIEAGAIGAVICYRLDRLHRQPRELEHFIDLANRHRVALATVTGDTDLSTEEGRLVARIMGAVDRAEVEKKSARQKLANRQRAKAGKPWNQRTFGYDGNTIVPEEAKAIRNACHALLNGATLWSIAKDWNAQGLKTSRGYLWEGSKVRQVLLRPSIAGLAVHNGEILEGAKPAWKPIVARDTYESVRKYLADPKRFTGRSMGRKHLLSGIAYCGECNRRMGTVVKPTKTGGKRVVYQCKNVGCMKIVRDLVRTDELVVGVITQRLADPDAARKLSKPTVDTKKLHQQIDTLRKLITATREEYNEGLIDARDRNARVERITEKLSPLEDKLLGSHMSADVKRLAGNPDAAELFEDLPLDRRRGVIDTLATVTIHRQTAKGGKFDPRAVAVEWK